MSARILTDRGGPLVHLPGLGREYMGGNNFRSGAPGWGARFSQAGDWLRNAGGSVGKYALPIGVGAAALGVGALGARYVAYPLVKGSLDPDLRYQLGKNPLTSFLTGEDHTDPDLIEKMNEKTYGEKEEKNRALRDEELARIDQSYRDKALFDTKLAYDHAQDMSDLELGVRNIDRQNVLTSQMLGSSVGNYINMMGRSNEALQSILSNQVRYN